MIIMIILKTKHKKLEKQGLNDCVYNPVKPNTLKMEKGTISIISPHEFCNHKHYCIFNEKREDLERNITKLENELHESLRVKNLVINGEIDVPDNFINNLNRNVDNLEYDLRNLNNFRLDVLHGKVSGYGNF